MNRRHSRAVAPPRLLALLPLSYSWQQLMAASAALTCCLLRSLPRLLGWPSYLVATPESWYRYSNARWLLCSASKGAAGRLPWLPARRGAHFGTVPCNNTTLLGEIRALEAPQLRLIRLDVYCRQKGCSSCWCYIHPYSLLLLQSSFEPFHRARTVVYVPHASSTPDANSSGPNVAGLHARFINFVP